MKIGSVAGRFAVILAITIPALCTPRAWADESSPSKKSVPPKESSWALPSLDFKTQLHALAAEALILQIKPQSSSEAAGSGRSPRLSRVARQDGESRLAESLKSANALLSMIEIAEHSDRGDRVRRILTLWLESSRITLSDDLQNVGGFTGRAIDPQTAEFLEELKMIWRRLDAAYATLETSLETPVR